MSKGFVMSVFIILAIICLGYYFSDHQSTKVKMKPHMPLSTEQIGLNIKKEINTFFEDERCLSVAVDSFGRVYEDLRGVEDHSTMYIVVATIKLKSHQTCVSVLISDLEDYQIKSAISTLINKIYMIENNLRIRC